MNARDIDRGEQWKYAHYSVVRRDPVGPPVITESGDDLIRVIVDFRRVPSEQTFYWRPRAGISVTELRVAEQWASALPHGGWARRPGSWFRHRMTNGCWLWTQRCGLIIDESLERFSLWETEMTSSPLRVTT